MSLDEYLFGKIANYFRKDRSIDPDKVRVTVSLEDIRPRLTVLSRAIFGEPIEIFSAEREGGFKGNNIFLPASFNLLQNAEANLSLYFFRILYLSVQKQLALNHYGPGALTELEARQYGLDAAPIVLEKLYAAYPIAAALHQQLWEGLLASATPKKPADPSWLYGKWIKDNPNENNSKKDAPETSRSAMFGAEKPTTIMQARAVESV